MADHYAKATEALTRVEMDRVALSSEYCKPEPDRGAIQRHSAHMRNQMKTAEVHSLLAIAQRLDDLRSIR